VCRRFHTLLVHKDYWRWVGKYALRNMVPTHVLQDLDFFHGLGAEDPPWAWLGSLVLNRIQYEHRQKNLYFMWYKHKGPLNTVLRLSWLFSSKAYSLGITNVGEDFSSPSGESSHYTYFGHAFLRKRTVFYIDNGDDNVNCYVELWDAEKQKTWYGEPGCIRGKLYESTLHLLWPKEGSFGVWI